MLIRLRRERGDMVSAPIAAIRGTTIAFARKRGTTESLMADAYRDSRTR
jgi:hypothetical protein